MNDDLDDRVRKLEYGVFGLTGDNGLIAAVRELTKKLDEHARAEEKRREEDEYRRKEEAKAQKARKDEERRERRRNRLMLISILIAGISALATALLTIFGAN